MRTGIFRGSLLVLLLAAAGCGGAGSPASVTLPPLPSHTAAASSSGTPAPPPSSPAASATSPAASAVRAGPPPQVPETKAGAELFIRDYFATLDKALVTASTATVRSYLVPHCACATLEDWIDTYAAKHQHFGGNGFVLEQVTASEIANHATLAGAVFSVHHLPIFSASGGLIGHTTDNFSHDHRAIYLRYGDGTWHIADIKR